MDQTEQTGEIICIFSFSVAGNRLRTAGGREVARRLLYILLAPEIRHHGELQSLSNAGTRLMHTYSHIIWDWNGTLFDDAWLCRDIVNSMLAARGLHSMSEKRYLDIFDFPIKEYYARAGFDFSVDPYEILANEFIDAYERRRKECRLREGADTAVRAIARAGMRQSILSAYAQKTLCEIVQSFGIHEIFECLYGLDNHYAHGKEDIGRRMIAESGITASGAVLIGDTTHDFDVARALGTGCILVDGGHQSRAKLEACGVAVYETPGAAVSCIISPGG